MARIRRAAALVTLWHALRAARRPGAPGLGAYLAATPRMVRLGLTGRYPGLSKSRLVLAIVGLLYVISPVDFMPEALLGPFGLGDDTVVLAWIAGALIGETDAFLRWESHPSRTVVGEVAR